MNVHEPYNIIVVDFVCRCLYFIWSLVWFGISTSGYIRSYTRAKVRCLPLYNLLTVKKITYKATK